MAFGAFAPVARRRVAVTGVGVVTPVGTNVAGFWAALLAGASGVRSLRDVPHYLPSAIADDKRVSDEEKRRRAQLLYDSVACAVAAPVLGAAFAPTSREPRCHLFAKAAALEALQHARLVDSDGKWVAVPHDRVGVCIGMGMPSLHDVTDVSLHLCADPSAVATGKVSPFFVPKILGNMAASAVAMQYHLTGPINSAVTACATGAQCLADAANWIKYGEADVAVCGATEACLTPVAMAGFARMRALSSKFNDNPQRASRPFDRKRCGFVMGEGAGIVVLEAWESARRRGVPILAELRGCASTSDAHHVTAPHPEGAGARRCIARCLEDAGGDVRPSDVAYVNAHATGTPMGDEIELAALEAVLRSDKDASAPPLIVSSSKGSIGHLLGAAGAVEAVAAILALRHGVAPPNVNLEEPIEYDARRVTLNTQPQPMPGTRAVVSTSFGFGGTNACLLFTSADGGER